MTAVNSVILLLFTAHWYNFGSCESLGIAECCKSCVAKVRNCFRTYRNIVTTSVVIPEL